LAARLPSAGCTRDTACRRRRIGRLADERPTACLHGPRRPIPCLRKRDRTSNQYGAFVGIFRVTTIRNGWTRRGWRASNIAMAEGPQHAMGPRTAQPGTGHEGAAPARPSAQNNVRRNLSRARGKIGADLQQIDDQRLKLDWKTSGRYMAVMRPFRAPPTL
jgi:hypothetical protein